MYLYLCGGDNTGEYMQNQGFIYWGEQDVCKDFSPFKDINLCKGDIPRGEIQDTYKARRAR